MRRILLVGVGLAIAGCVTHVPMSTDYRGPHARPIPEFAFDDSSVPIVVSGEETLRTRGDFSIRHVTLPSNVTPHGSIEFEYYDVHATARTPVVVLLPIFNGQLIITRFFARYFANQGWAAVVVMRERDPLADLDMPEPAIRANLAEYERVLDWVDQQAELDPARIGVFGISFGAMDAVMLTALDTRVDALVVAMAGGDLASLLTTTNYRRVARAVANLLETTGQTREALRASFEHSITTDPLALAPYVNAEHVLMIMTRTDAIVPFAQQEALRASLGAPETLYLPTGHRTSVLYLPMVRSSAYEFFLRRFADAQLAVARD